VRPARGAAGAGLELSKLLSFFYGWRSAITHGNRRTMPDPQEFHREMWRFERVVRDILRAALDRIPIATDTRIEFLDGLAAMSDAERLRKITIRRANYRTLTCARRFSRQLRRKRWTRSKIATDQLTGAPAHSRLAS
jgi:hypothetical protein